MAQPPSSSHSHSSSRPASDHPSKDFLRLGKNPYNLITYKKSRSIYLITSVMKKSKEKHSVR